MNPISILVIDDEADNFDVIDAFLHHQDYQLHYAASGQAALSSLDFVQPDVILLDVMMPEMDGLEVCQRIKAMSKWRSVPIIMITALSAKEDMASCLESGADDFISKPVNSVELRARLQSMLRIKQQYDSLQSFSQLQRNTINFLNGSLQELRSSLALSLSHELNTPLNGIIGGLDLLLVDLENMSLEEMRELLNLSYFSACRLEKLIRKLLNYLSLELATFQPSDQNSDTDIIQPLAQTLAQAANRCEDLVCQVEQTKLTMPSQALQSVVEELLDNAFKFSERGTPVILRGEVSNGMFNLSIIDQGRGMSFEQIHKIGAFMQFGRVTYKQQGAGLGLAIAKKTVELYRGRFQVSGAASQGTTVHMTLPLAGSQGILQVSQTSSPLTTSVE